MKIRYKKPSGVVMLINDTETNREYAKVNRWEEIIIEEEKKPAKKKKVDKVKQLDKLI